MKETKKNCNTYGIAFNFTSNFRCCADVDIVGDNDDVLFHDVPLLSKPVVRLPPLLLCNDVDIADGTWTDVDGWMLRLVAVGKILVPDDDWFKWLGNCELFNDVDIRFVDTEPLGANDDVDAMALTFVCCCDPIEVDCVSVGGSWHGDFGEWAFVDIGIAVAKADVEDDSGDAADDVDANEIWLLNAMEDECNGFTFDD